MTERERIVGYVPDDTALEVEKLAERNDQSVSEYVAEAVSEKVQQDKLGSMAEEYSVEMKLLRLVDSAADRIADESAEAVAETVIDEFDDRGLLDSAATDDDSGTEWSVSD